MSDRFGWVGLGGMGGPMASNVARAGLSVTVCDVRPEPVAELEALGAASAPTAIDVAAACEVMFVSLPNKDVSRQVAEEVFAAAIRPELYVELSTLSPSVMRDLAARAEAAGVRFADSPVSGNVRARREGTLSVMFGGASDDFARARPVLDAIGGNVFHLGDVGAGSVAKIANNLIALTSMVTAMEGLLLGRRHGLDVTELKDVVMTASGAGPQVLGVEHQYRTRRYRESVTPQAALRLAVKDLELGVELAAEVGLPVVTAQAALGLWRQAEDAGMAETEIFALLDYLEAQGF